ncbi:MAG: amino acid-binding protein [Gammaproteobacteria bacterium]|nr:MAG: amino acid-binding protein [Gammaproteobacteria bacterium]
MIEPGGQQNWYMLTVVGQDRPGIVAALTQALYEGGCHLGEASMMRLGENFTVMMMVTGATENTLKELTAPVAERMQLRIHIDPIRARLHHHREPDVQINVYGADRTGIVAEVTGALAEAGMNIVDLNSDVAGTEEKPVYIMLIDGYASQGIAALERALASLKDKGVDVRLTPVETLVG